MNVYLVEASSKYPVDRVWHLWGVYASLKLARKAVKQYSHAWRFTIKRQKVVE